MDNLTRQKVIISTSTLHVVQLLQGWGWGDQTAIHCDMETISQLNTLRHTWERSYACNPIPIDTIVVGGLNDIKSKVQIHMSNKVGEMDR